MFLARLVHPDLPVRSNWTTSPLAGPRSIFPEIVAVFLQTARSQPDLLQGQARPALCFLTLVTNLILTGRLTAGERRTSNDCRADNCSFEFED
jgi:hypothetical protein